MTEQELNSIIYFDKVAQLAIVLFISILFYKVIKFLKFTFFYWISLGFFFNFIYIAFGLFSFVNFPWHAKFSNDIPMLTSTIASLLTSFFFSVAVIQWYKSLRTNNAKLSENINNYSQDSKFFLTKYDALGLINCATALLLLIYDDHPNQYTKYASIAYGAGSLALISLVFVRISKSYSKYIWWGFILWSGLQLLSIFPEKRHEINIIGFTTSLLAKILILYGSCEFYVGYANERKEQSEFFVGSNNLLRNIFHDIIFPLYELRMQLKKIQDRIPPDAKHLFADIKSNFERVQTIISISKRTYIEDLNKKNTSEDPIDDLSPELDIEDEERIVNINRPVEMAVRSVKNSVPYSDTKIKFTISYGSECYIKCRSSEIIQALTNLLKNSIEAYQLDNAYSQDDEKLILIKTYKTRLPNNTRLVVIEIEDHAVGIKSEDLSKIWQPGFSTKMMNIKNTIKGQGLHIVRSMLDKYPDAEIVVESPIKIKDNSVIKGTKFKLLFTEQKFPD